VEVDRLIGQYGELYHMAEAGSWPSIQEHGLLSTSALLDLFQITGERRRVIESEHRQESVTLHHSVHGTAVVRDQKPMPPERLRPCLRGLSEQEWYRLINGMTFFWPDTTPLSWMNNAPPYRTRSHDVLVVRTRDLVSRYHDQVRLSDQNSGSANKSLPRGRDLFKTIEGFKAPYLRELAVIYSVPEIRECVSRVEEWRGGERRGIVWRS